MSIFETVAKGLSDLKGKAEESRGDGQFRMAKLYCEQYEALAVQLREEGEKSPTPQKINRRIRAVEGYAGPGSSFLSDAKRVGDVFPDFFVSKRKNYETVRQIAVAAIPDEVKHELRKALDAGATQADIRQRIRDASDAASDCDFKIQVSNCWRFGKNPLPATFDGGIHPELVANLIHHFSDAGEHIVDPMAGGGTTGGVLSHYRWFTQEHPEWPVISGRRSVEMFDAAPARKGIKKCDSVAGPIPAKRKADLVIFDPPYWGIADGKYENLGESLEDWLQNVGRVFVNIAAILNDGGRVCAVVDDYSRASMTVPLFFLMARKAEEAGLSLASCVYNAYPNYVVTMGPAEMYRCKRGRVLVNEMKVVGVFIRKDATDGR